MLGLEFNPQYCQKKKKKAVVQIPNVQPTIPQTIVHQELWEWQNGEAPVVNTQASREVS
jgi:hypothetical protein